MRRLGTMVAFSLLAAAPLVLTGAGWADEPFKPEEGYVSLFNGKDLSGWRYKGSPESLDGKTATPDGRVRTEGGVIVVREKDDRGKAGIKELATAREFPKDFHLKLEFRAAP